jgi:hypothetical protein
MMKKTKRSLWKIDSSAAYDILGYDKNSITFTVEGNLVTVKKLGKII